MSTGQKSDLELANAALLEIKQNVSASDRKSAPASGATIVQYLNGLGTELDTAMKLLSHFRGRIEERRKELTEPVTVQR